MAVSAAMRFSKQMMKNALSAAVTSVWCPEVIDDSSQIKPYNSGKAALNGLLSAFIGNAGLNGPEDVLGGNEGFSSYGGSERREYMSKQT